MKFFAPRNAWNYKSGDGWFNLRGQHASSGVRVTYDKAESLAAVSCGIRVYAEAIAQLPCQIVEQRDFRTKRAATDHPLWRVVHDEPNPEQTKFQFFAFMTACAVGWGNGYAEIQRNSTGDIVALWPIHPSRIPRRNITRNSRDASLWSDIVVGEPGEIVYWVQNDDGSKFPIAARDMLSLPGVLSQDGITGRGIIEIGASALGIALATEEHAGAFFRNGAAPNMVIKSPKVVGKETAERLREQWQLVFGGVKNHYKTILLEEGMEAVPFFISPEASQLLTSRQFSVDEIARILKLPPHKLNSLNRATWANIEQQAQEFVDYSLMPWVKQWEESLYKRLLSDEDKKRYRFRINVMALLRGDSQARAAFYRALFDMGALSPNDIRELEDWNPNSAGDQYFVPANNLVPLGAIDALAQAQIERARAEAENAGARSPDAAQSSAPPTAADAENLIAAAAVREARAAAAAQATRDAIRLSIQAVIEGMMHREERALSQAAKKPERFLAWCDEFYGEFRSRLTAAIAVFAHAAEQSGAELCADSIANDYVADSLARLAPLADLPCSELAPALAKMMDSWDGRPAHYAAGALTEKEIVCTI